MRTSLVLLLILAGLIVLGVLAGPAPALWVALALAVCVAVNRSGALFREAPHALGIIGTLIGVSMALGVAAPVLLFMAYGWLPPVAFVALVLVLLLKGVGETSDDRGRHPSRQRAGSA